MSLIEHPKKQVHAWRWDGSQTMAVALTLNWGLHTVANASLRGELHFVSGAAQAVEVAAVGDWIYTPDEGLTFYALPAEDFDAIYQVQS